VPPAITPKKAVEIGLGHDEHELVAGSTRQDVMVT
jgi:hypothetical protein